MMRERFSVLNHIIWAKTVRTLERVLQGKPAGVFSGHRTHSVRGTLSGAVSSER
ncbi:phage DNA methyltransferase [Escherichia coli DEC12A]|nr:phage DNA methyltransferase [Escherichia coli DEC12A]